MSGERRGVHRKVLRTTSPELVARPSFRKKPSFRASKGEKEENTEIKLLNLGFPVKAKVVVDEGDVFSVPYVKATTCDGLPFFVSLPPEQHIAPQPGERVYIETTLGPSEDDISAVRAALDLLCSAAFVCESGYCFVEYADTGEQSITTLRVRESRAGGSGSSDAAAVESTEPHPRSPAARGRAAKQPLSAAENIGRRPSPRKRGSTEKHTSDPSFDGERQDTLPTRVSAQKEGAPPQNAQQSDEAIFTEYTRGVWEAYPLVRREELVADPEAVLDNIREAWKRLYDFESERSGDALAALSRKVSDVVDAHNAFAETVESVSADLTDDISSFVTSHLQLRDQMRMGHPDPGATTLVESRLALRHEALRKLHAAVAATREALGELENVTRMLVKLNQGVTASKRAPVEVVNDDDDE